MHRRSFFEADNDVEDEQCSANEASYSEPGQPSEGVERNYF